MKYDTQKSLRSNFHPLTLDKDKCLTTDAREREKDDDDDKGGNASAHRRQKVIINRVNDSFDKLCNTKVRHFPGKLFQTI